MQAALPEDTVLIEYVRYLHYLGKAKTELRYGAVLLSADAPPRWVTLGSAKGIKATLRHCRAAVRDPKEDDEVAAILEKVCTDVWKPVEEAFPVHTKKVIVSPDGQLNFLSFATLLEPEKRFVAEKYLVQYVTIGRDLLSEPPPAFNKQVIVMADPKLRRSCSTCRYGVALSGFGRSSGCGKNATSRI